jgi:hypothetical protein
MAASAQLLRDLLGPAGDPARERLFRMQVTLCLQRAATPEEIAMTPDYFKTDPPIDLAGGPVEILEESEEGSLTTQPCLNPTHLLLDPHTPLLWAPVDCQQCEPCRARQLLQAERDVATGGLLRGFR